jgi:dipeptidyl aminopeptidase/acylaminoacyl peptidase
MNPTLTPRHFGLWDSPVTPLSLARGLTFSDLRWDHDGTLVWREGRADRAVLVVRKPDRQAPRDLNSELSVRAKVGYGGGDFSIGQGHAYFAEAESGRLYRQPLACGAARPITPAFGQYAAPALSPNGKWLLFIHTYEGQDSLGIVDAQGKEWPRRLITGEDFYMQPVWHPAGKSIAWIAWNHPNMPWDGTFLRLGKLEFPTSGLPVITSAITLAGDEKTSIFQPEFSPDGRFLSYVSDAAGWWQLYLYDLEGETHRCLTAEPADHGVPAWIQGMRTYAFSPDGQSLYFIRNEQGFSSLWQVEIASGIQQKLPLDEAYTWLEQIAISPHDGRIALLASGNTTPPRVISFRSGEEECIHQRGTSEEISPGEYSPAQSISWSGMDGGTVYGLYYPPHNPHFSGLGKPPLIVRVHGGPTSQARAAFNATAQFFATRGYAFLEVNHRGSTGYGRAYWEALKGKWGIYDVQDSICGARFLAEQGWVDETRRVIMGGSAGGFTVLQALVDFPGFFKAGICLYGVTNQFSLVAVTHKFEARYSDSLLGSLPEAAEVYRARSPLFHADKIQDPLILFQGEEDTAVPRAQSDAIVALLRQRGVPHEYHLYPGEGHGFLKTQTIEHLYTTAHRFLRQYVIFA